MQNKILIGDTEISPNLLEDTVVLCFHCTQLELLVLARQRTAKANTWCRPIYVSKLGVKTKLRAFQHSLISSKGLNLLFYIKKKRLSRQD